jgi:hypothetical protein
MTGIAQRPFCGNCGNLHDLYYFKIPVPQANSMMWLIRCNNCMDGRGDEYAIILAKCSKCELGMWCLIIRSENPEDIKCPKCGTKSASPAPIGPMFDPRKQG